VVRSAAGVGCSWKRKKHRLPNEGKLTVGVVEEKVVAPAAVGKDESFWTR
jgi:hypothetical protein